MAGSFLPASDSALLAWSVNFNNLITATEGAYGLTTTQQMGYSDLHNAYAAAYQTAVDPGTRTKGAVQSKNDARLALKDDARLLAKVIEGQASVTNEQKIDLGLNVRKEPTPIPVPDTPPDLDVLAVTGRTVQVRIHDAQTPGRRKPEGVKGATVLCAVGEAPPNDAAGWTFKGSTTRSVFDVNFPDSVEPGSKVWVTAFWFNPRLESGPAAVPVSTYTQFGLSQAA